MSDIPDDRYYIASHQWVKPNDDGTALVGITDFAQEELGDIVFVELPEISSQINALEEISVVESVKTASDVYSPVSGEVVAINDVLEDSPETINTSPYDNGWIFKIRMSDEAELEDLLGAEEYREACEDA